MSWHPLDYVDWMAFQRAADEAARNVVIAEAVRSADHFFHTIFIAGEEPKWSDPSQRKACLEHVDAMMALAREIGVARSHTKVGAGA